MSVSTLERPEIVSGRFVEGMPEEEYHAHPALSASGMKVLLRSPKHFRFDRSQNKAKTEFDVGHAVHARVLGVGAPIVEIPASLLSGANMAISSEKAKAWVAAQRAEGNIPLKPSMYMKVVKASDAVMKNEKARRLLEPEGFTELSLFAQDPITGVQLRCRIDRLAAGKLIDLKTTVDVSPRKITNAVIDLGYDVSAAVYRYLVELVTGEPASPMHLIFVEKEPPYDVRVIRLADPGWQTAGEAKMRAAIDLFAWCTERGEWPSEDEDGGEIHDLPVPAWYERQTTTTEEGWL